MLPVQLVTAAELTDVWHTADVCCEGVSQAVLVSAVARQYWSQQQM